MSKKIYTNYVTILLLLLVVTCSDIFSSLCNTKQIITSISSMNMRVCNHGCIQDFMLATMRAKHGRVNRLIMLIYANLVVNKETWIPD